MVNSVFWSLLIDSTFTLVYRSIISLKILTIIALFPELFLFSNYLSWSCFLVAGFLPMPGGPKLSIEEGETK